MSLYDVSDNHYVRDIKTRMYSAMQRWFFGPCQEDWKEWERTAKENKDDDWLSAINKAEMIGSYLDIQGWIDSAYEAAKEEIWKIQTTFATQEEAMEWMTNQVDDDYMDNERFAFVDNNEQMLTYDIKRSNGCCGEFEATVTVNGREAVIGCNYGH